MFKHKENNKDAAMEEAMAPLLLPTYNNNVKG
jgi:hypothetical protein